MYRVEVWCGALWFYKDVFIKIQKIIVRILVSASYNAHATPSIKTINIMTFDNIYNYFTSMYIHV